MKIGYCSDLHLEFKDYRFFPECSGGNILILAGDILTAKLIASHRTDKDYRSIQKYAELFKEQVLDKYSAVYYVMGNHEHYGSTFSQTKAILVEGLERIGWNKVKLFDNDYAIVQDVLFLGATLWSDFENISPISMWECARGMNDFRVIYQDSENRLSFTPELAYQEHKNTLSYFREILKLHQGMKTVVFTHHAPTLVSLNKEHVGNGLDGAYASDLSDFILGWPQIQYWVHGHTHMNANYSVGDYTKVVAHQCGYRGERSWKQFVGPMHFEVK